MGSPLGNTLYIVEILLIAAIAVAGWLGARRKADRSDIEGLRERQNQKADRSDVEDLQERQHQASERIRALTVIREILRVPHSVYAEPFVGMGGVFLRRPESASK